MVHDPRSSAKDSGYPSFEMEHNLSGKERMLEESRSRGRGFSDVKTLQALVVCFALAVPVAAICGAAAGAGAAAPAPTPALSPQAQVIFGGANSLWGVQPSMLYPAPSKNTRLVRWAASYAGTPMASSIVSGGTSIIYSTDANRTMLFHLYTDIVNNSFFGEYASTTGLMGNRAVRLRVQNPRDDSEFWLTPFGMTMSWLMPNASTLIPDFFHFQYKPAGAPPSAAVSTFVSTTLKGGLPIHATFFNDIGKTEWHRDAIPFFNAYWAALHYAPPSGASSGGAARARRRAGLLSDVEGAVGDAEDAYNDVSDAESDVDSVVDSSDPAAALGNIVADKVGSSLESLAGDAADDLGEEAGASIGGAIGGALGSFLGPAGAVVGEEVGSYAGSLGGK